MTVSTKEEAFHRVSAALERAKDQILSGIPERDHVDAMRGVIELIEEHNEEHVKYILGKMCLEMTQLSASLKAIQGESELQQALQQILPDRVKRLAIAEHDLLQLQIQLDEVQKENTMIKRTNTQLTENLEDAKTRLAEIQLRMESSRATDSSIMLGDETAALKEKIEALEVELEELKNINEFNDDMLQHKEADIEELDQKCEGLTQLNSQLMTRLEIMNREMNELKITSEEFDVKSEAGSASTGSGDRAGFTSVPGPESAALGINASAPRGADHKSADKADKLRRASQLFSQPKLTQEFARQKVSTTQNKADKSTYSTVVESASMMAQKLGLTQALHVSDFPALKEADQRKSLDMFISTCKDMAKAGDLTVEKAKVFTSIQTAFSKAISNTNHQHRNYLRTALKENGLLRMTASLEKLYDKALEQFERDPEMMDRVRQAYLQDQRYMTNFVRILLVPLSTALNYDFNGGGESTRDGQVKFTDLTEATGNGLTALALANTHHCKS